MAGRRLRSCAAECGRGGGRAPLPSAATCRRPPTPAHACCAQGDQLIATSGVVFNKVTDYGGVSVKGGQQIVRMSVQNEVSRQARAPECVCCCNLLLAPFGLVVPGAFARQPAAALLTAASAPSLAAAADVQGGLGSHRLAPGPHTRHAGVPEVPEEQLSGWIGGCRQKRQSTVYITKQATTPISQHPTLQLPTGQGAVRTDRHSPAC